MLKYLFSPNLKTIRNVNRVSPNMSMNTSLGLNCSNTSHTKNSPGALNISEEMAKVLPRKSGSKHRFSFSPMPVRIEKSPNVSPIKSSSSQSGTPSSSFLKRRDFNSYNLTGQCDQMARSPMLGIHLTPNVNLEKRLSVNTVLKDLELLKLEPLFEEEEIDLPVLFTLNHDDLTAIGVSDQQDRKKILEFIRDFKTPDKNVKMNSRF